MRAIKFLQRYMIERRKVNKLRERITEVDDLFSFTQDMTSERVQSSPKQDRLGEIVAEKVDLEADLMDEVALSLEIMNEIEEVINKVQDTRQQELLQKRYIRVDEETKRQKTWERIAEEFGYSDPRWLYVLHKRALREVERLLNGMDKE